jgi:hypothetical protein
MTIPATAITIDGPTAWWVIDLKTAWRRKHDNRPCDTCAKIRAALGNATRNDEPCLSCGEIDGRHTFTIDVECVLPMCVNGKRGYWQDGHPCGRCRATGTYQLSVHVVEVLEIHGATEHWPDATHLSMDEGNMTVWLWTWTGQGFDFTQNYCTLPADAADGMYAVRLAVAA